MRTWPLRILLPLCLALAVASCSREKLGPDTEGPSGEPIGEAAIGPSGGRIEVEDFVLDVPAGAFPATRTIRLFRDSAGNPFAGRTASDKFRIVGIPREFGSPIAFATRVTTGAPVKIAIGEEVFRHGMDEPQIGWRLMDGRDSSGWSLWELPPPELARMVPAQDSSSTPPIQVTTATDNGDHTTPAGHFRISYPVGTVTLAQAVQLGVDLENAFNYFTTLGFACNRSWPVSVTVRQLDPNLYGGWSASGWGANSCYLEFNSLFVGRPEMPVTVGHEIFHMFQYFYDPRSAWSKASDGGPAYWFDEACATWVEEKFAANPSTHISDARANNELNPLAGISAGAPANPAAHGYGMSSLIRFLVRQQGNEGFLLQSYTRLRNGAGVIPAIQQSISTPLPQSWSLYITDLLRGSIYSDVTGDMARDNRSGLWRITSAADTAATFTDYYPDLSGRLYAVRPIFPQISEEATLIATVGAHDSRLAAYRYIQGQPLALISAGADSINVPGLRAMQADTAWVMILVANSYTSNADCSGSTSITLRMRLNDLPDLSRFRRASVAITYQADWGGGNIVPRQNLLISTTRGRFQGNLFVAEWDSIDTSSQMRYTGHIYATLNPDDLSLTDWSAENRWIYPMPNTYNLYQANGTRIPLSQSLEGYLKHSIVGAGACGAITDIVVTQVADGVVTRNLADHSCTSESSISVTFLGNSVESRRE